MSGAEIYDVIVVGGGPSGMMTSAVAASRGNKVLLIEKNESLGKKLLITGGGRCNVTNAEFDNRKFLEKFKKDGDFLFSTFSQWNVKNTLDFFHSKGMETKVEKELRVFPVTDSAKSVWDVLIQYMSENNVKIISNSPVTELIVKNKLISGVKLKNKEKLKAKSIIIATGGTSRPETGSTGDGYNWLEKIGHKIIYPKPSLVPIKLKEKWINKLAGITLTDIKITAIQNNIKQISSIGKILFTHMGVTGPTILNMSKDIGELLKYDEVIFSLDLFPNHDHGMMNNTLQELFKNNNNKKIQNTLPEIIPKTISSTIIKLAKINPDKKCNEITRNERMVLIEVLKNFKLNVDKLLGEEKAIITSGGVDLNEVDFKTMRSKIIPNLYLVGDILNINRPSGGYSLQLCWSTGFVAGNSV